MATIAKSNKTIVTHPISGTKRKFDTAVYELIKAAILQSLKGSKGKTFTELTNDVVKIIQKKMPGFTKSIPWYTISIRLDLETKGIVETFTEKARPADHINTHGGQSVGRGEKLNRLKNDS